jgi:hypothetical protein
MAPSNRVDEMSEHLQWLALTMIEALPNTLKRLKIRATNAIFDGQNNLDRYRQIHHRIDLSDTVLAERYDSITTAAMIPQHSWKTEYARYLLELRFCTQTILEGNLQHPESEMFNKRRSKVMILLVQFEKEHRLVRWNLDDEEYTDTKRQGIEMWIDSLVDELRAATAGELYSQNVLYDHGHGKASLYDKGALLIEFIVGQKVVTPATKKIKTAKNTTIEVLRYYNSVRKHFDSQWRDFTKTNVKDQDHIIWLNNSIGHEDNIIFRAFQAWSYVQRGKEQLEMVQNDIDGALKWSQLSLNTALELLSHTNTIYEQNYRARKYHEQRIRHAQWSRELMELRNSIDALRPLRTNNQVLETPYSICIYSY